MPSIINAADLIRLTPWTALLVLLLILVRSAAQQPDVWMPYFVGLLAILLPRKRSDHMVDVIERLQRSSRDPKEEDPSGTPRHKKSRKRS